MGGWCETELSVRRWQGCNHTTDEILETQSEILQQAQLEGDRLAFLSPRLRLILQDTGSPCAERQCEKEIPLPESVGWPTGSDLIQVQPQP